MDFLKNALLVGFSLMVGFVLVESALRLGGYSRPMFYRYDFEIGATHRANLAGFFEKEDLIYVRMNSDGIRSPRDYALEKPDPNLLRIAVLGDSFTEAIQVEFGQRFSEVMEKNLAACPAISGGVEVINFGVSGMGTTREIVTYREKAAKYDPDIVLLMFYHGNDFRNNDPNMGNNVFFPYYVFHDGQLILDQDFQEDPTFLHKLKWSNLRNTIANHFRVGHLLNEIYLDLRSKKATAAAPVEVAKITPKKQPYVLPTDPVWQAAWAVTEAQLALFADEVNAEGRVFVLSSVAAGDAVSPDPAKRAASDVLNNGEDGLDYVEGRLGLLAEVEGFSFIGLQDAMAAGAQESGNSVLYFDYLGREGGHWNAYGHALAGEQLAEEICRLQ